MTAMTPLHLLLLLTAFIWALTLNNAGVGLGFFFTPDWGLLGSPTLWIEALSQVAWDTGAAFGIFLVLGASMTRKTGPVKNVVWTTAINGLISLIVGVTVFCTVFATYTKVNPDGTEADVVNLLRTNGPANTGLTFIWLPILFSTMTGGRVMASLFFLAVVIATFSNYITLMNTSVQAMVDWGVKRSVAVVVIATLTFLLGVPSAVNIHVLVNQVMFCRYVLLLNGLALLVWWVVHTIQSADSPWYQLGNQSLMTAILEWFVIGMVLLVLNLLFVRYRARMSGCWSSLIAKQEDIPACPCGYRHDKGDSDNLIAVTDQAGERPVPDYSTINH
uniref:Uncharacterized protein n=1 Tax=Branchiostoma floridae TaxID=7739 RepID=C3ZVS9_BRAFL|eukprot:XP_002587333.1 hypothetical protein BRAFLDRAFT_100529 [Branchiostoma floridae]